MNKNIRPTIFAFIGCIVILTIGGLVYNQMYKNYHANQAIIKECFEQFEGESKVMITKKDVWSPVICEVKN
ncbi:hypothetical protein ACNRWW_10740 [Metabacillus sp. HB246100]